VLAVAITHVLCVESVKNGLPFKTKFQVHCQWPVAHGRGYHSEQPIRAGHRDGHGHGVSPGLVEPNLGHPLIVI
jgi:hypothetical protein